MRKHHKKQHGFSLIELMIAMVIGLIVMAGIIGIFGDTLNNNRQLLTSARLNQDISTIMTLMSTDIRRAGYGGAHIDTYGGGDPANQKNAPQASLNIVQYNGTPSCLLYSYDRDLDNPDTDLSGTVDAADGNIIEDTDRYGFRLNDDTNSISMRYSCDPATEDCDDDCDVGEWEQITDPNVIRVSTLRFSSVGSKCKNMESRAYWITQDNDPATADDDDPAVFPCYTDDARMEGEGGPVQLWTWDTVNKEYTEAATAPSSADDFDALLVTPDDGAQDPTDETTLWSRFVETRQVRIYIEADLVADANLDDRMKTRKELTAQVKVGNNRIFVPPTVGGP